MFETPTDLFKFNNTEQDEMGEMIDTMGETLYDAMVSCQQDNRIDDAISCYQEWVVDGVDPQDGGFEFTFIQEIKEL